MVKLSETIINTSITPAIFSLILSLIFYFLYKEEDQQYLMFWSVSWFINTLIFVFHFIDQSDSSLLWEVLRRFSVNIYVIFFILGSLDFCGNKSKKNLIFITALITLWYIAGLYLKFNFLLLHAPINIVVGIAFILTAGIYLILPDAKQIGKTITAGSLFIIGISNSILPFAVTIWIIPQTYIFLVSTVAKLGLTIGILILHFERNKFNLNKTQASYKVLAENTPDIIFRYNFKFKQLEYINNAFTKATGYSCQEILSNPSLFMNILHPEYHQLARKLISSDFNSNDTLNFVAYNKNGQKIYFESHIIPQYSVDGQLIAIEGIIRDITQRKLMEEEIKTLEEQQKKQTEKALCTAEDRFSKTFYNSPYPMAIISKNFTHIDINYSFEVSTGYHERDFLSCNVKLNELLDNEHLNLKKLIIEGKRIRNLQFKYINKSEEKRIGLLSTEEIVFDGRQSLLLIINDISDLKKMENEIARLDRLNLIGQMAAGIGHEVRNPMTTVRGLLQFIRDKKKDIELKQHFDLMISELDRANSIITKFLSISKNTTDDLQLDNLNKIIISLKPLLQADALNQGKDIVIELEEIPNIYVNRKEIHQLILNLVRNGLESMQESGSVTIKTFVDREKVVFFIKDEGHGIDSSIFNKLGTPFLTTKAKGTGLGLATCYSIVERHHAEIDVDTTPAGTTFYVRFNVAN